MYTWSNIYTYRKYIRKKYPSIWKIKLAKKILHVLTENISETSKILDIGAGNRKIGEKIKSIYPSVIYKSMDINNTEMHDYHSVEEIKEQFNIVLLLEVIEHLTFSEATKLLEQIKPILDKDGIIIISTPNTFHPTRYWEYSHKTPYRYDEISGLLLVVGYSIKSLFRIYNDAFFIRLIKLYITLPLFKHLSIDFARSIVIVAENNNKDLTNILCKQINK